MLFLLLLPLLLLFFPLFCAQWAPSPQAHYARHQQQMQMPLLTSEPIVHGVRQRAHHLGCVLCISCCCMCSPPSLSPQQPRPTNVPSEQPPLVPLPPPPSPQPQFGQFDTIGGGGGSAQMPFHQPIPFDQQQGTHFPFTPQQNAQTGGAPFVGSPTAGYLSPSTGPVQLGQTQQQQNLQQMSLSEFDGTLSKGGGGGEPGILRNFQGDQFTNDQRILETREMNGPFFEQIGGEPNYRGEAENEQRKEYKSKEKKTN